MKSKRNLKESVMKTESVMHSLALLLLAAVLSTPSTVLAQKKTPECYVKEGTWWETMIASSEAIEAKYEKLESEAATARAADPAVARFEPQVIALSKGEKKVRFKLNVSGLREIVFGGRRNSEVTFSDLKVEDLEGNTRPLENKELKGMCSKYPHSPTARIRLSIGRSNVQIGGIDLGIKLDGEFRTIEGSASFPKLRANARASLSIDTYSPYRFSYQKAIAVSRLKDFLPTEFSETEGAGREMENEVFTCQIYDEGWKAGDYAELAKRYAALTKPVAKATAETLAKNTKTLADLGKVRDVYWSAEPLEELLQSLKGSLAPLRLAIQDLSKTFPDKYSKGPEFLTRLAAFETEMPGIVEGVSKSDHAALKKAEEFKAFKREALLANPLLDFDRILLVKRPVAKARASHKSKTKRRYGPLFGLPSLNSHTADTIPQPGTGWDDTIEVLYDLRAEPTMKTIYDPEQRRIVSDMDLHFDGKRIMFSSGNERDEWNLYEFTEDNDDVIQLTPTNTTDIDYFDSCYMPNGKIVTTSTAGYQGLPCEGGSKPMACLYLLDPRTKNIRQLAFEQDSDWCPTVLPDGRLMYLRWEYTDAPHYFTRILFTCNPDGTAQMQHYGSNSYFPNAFFYARPIPGFPTQVIGVAGGHHGVPRCGRLLILDTAVSKFEADGVVQEIPGYGKKVEPVIIDRLVDDVLPLFLNPYPLSNRYHLVSMKKKLDSLWGIYLVDVFDNMVLLKEVEGSALFEPIPYRPTPVPPVIPDRIDPSSKTATVFLGDVHYGPGLKGVPRGKVKSLRLFTYHYGFIGTGGHASVGMESSWDIKRILGTVPVEKDGSALFTIPANMPVSLQPLDEKGRAVQIMRSWLVGMPGETVSCNGCHENPSDAPPPRRTIAAARAPSAIQPWYGPARPFSFALEVQPVLDKYCLGCHNGKPREDGKEIPNFTAQEVPEDRYIPYMKDDSYMALQEYAKRPGPESDYHLTTPMEYHVQTSELFQMLEKGHHNVKLDEEAWSRLATWVDLNAPHRGSWYPSPRYGHDQRERRVELAKIYANVDTDVEGEFESIAGLFKKKASVKPIMPAPLPKRSTAGPKLSDWPMTPGEAKNRQGSDSSITLRLKCGASIDMMRIPSGELAMGSHDGANDEYPVHAAKIAKPFWMAALETSNELFSRFKPEHESKYIDMGGKDHNTRGYPANLPDQPVIRVSWQEAMEFCEWVSKETGKKCTLPTEAQWEWACRAGSGTDMWYGTTDDDFSKKANLADMTAFKNRIKGKKGGTTPFPCEARFDDGHHIVCATGTYTANPWGLKDMHGNVSEWTRSSYRPYPYADDGRNGDDSAMKKVARGGSWHERPKRATASYRVAYEQWQRIMDVGFRIIVED